MKEFLFEDIAAYFSGGPVAVTKGEFVRTPIIGATLRRNNELDLILDMKSRGGRKDKPQRYPAGTVRRADNEIEFHHPAGWKCVARGVIERSWSSSSNAAGEDETVETYSAQSVELHFERQVQPSYAVEWILNVPDGLIWIEPVRFTGVETLTKVVGSGDSQVRMTRSIELSGSDQSLHLRVLGTDLYVIRSSDREGDEKRPGHIVYRGCPNQAFRDKVRTCLSFVLGKPAVYLGHTEYCNEWTPTFMRSVDGLSIDGAAFKLHEQPPYPINQPRYTNIIDQQHVSVLVSALLDQFEAIGFGELSWSYWYAMCAPVHAAAAHFGSLIEQLQKNSSKVIEIRRSLLDTQDWAGSMA